MLLVCTLYRVCRKQSSPPSYGTGGDYSFWVPTPDKARVAVFLDYQNVLQRGHGLYGRGKESNQCVPEPALVADMLASKRHVPSEAISILVFRGRPDPRKEPVLASANDRQKQQWERRDRRVKVVSHPLFYRNWPRDAPWYLLAHRPSSSTLPRPPRASISSPAVSAESPDTGPVPSRGDAPDRRSPGQQHTHPSRVTLRVPLTAVEVLGYKFEKLSQTASPLTESNRRPSPYHEPPTSSITAGRPR